MVKDQPGVTRDIQIEPVEIWGKSFDVIDTGGLTEAADIISVLIKEQVSEFLHSVDFLLVVMDGRIAACGGWSKRAALFGSDTVTSSQPELLDPETSPARIRAFFVHPDFARRGIGTALLLASEQAAREAGFSSCEMGATLAASRTADGGMFDHGAVKLCHPHCAKFCVLGGGSCS